MKKVFVIIAIAILLILSYLYISKNNRTPDITLEDSPEPKQSIKVENVEITDTYVLYENLDKKFSVLHPDYITPEDFPDGYTAFVIEGPTQKADTEFFDGMVVSFISSPLGDRSLEEFARENRDMLIDIQGEVVSGISNININGKNGLVFSDPVAQYIYLPQNNNYYLEVVNMTADPGNLGYKEISYKIIESILILD